MIFLLTNKEEEISLSYLPIIISIVWGLKKQVQPGESLANTDGKSTLNQQIQLDSIFISLDKFADCTYLSHRDRDNPNPGDDSSPAMAVIQFDCDCDCCDGCDCDCAVVAGEPNGHQSLPLPYIWLINTWGSKSNKMETQVG